MIHCTPLLTSLSYGTVHNLLHLWHFVLVPCRLATTLFVLQWFIISNTNRMPWTLTLFVGHTPSKILCSICCWFGELQSKFDVCLLFKTVHFTCWNFHAILLYVGSIDTLTHSMSRLHLPCQNVAVFTYLHQSQKFLKLPFISDR